MKMQDVINRLKAACPSLQGRAYHAAEFVGLENMESDIPAAFVSRRPPSFGNNTGMGALYSQPKRERFTVILFALATLDQNEPMQQTASEVLAALAGWIPDGEPDVEVQPDGSADEAPQAGLVRWDLDFSYQDYQRTIR